MSHLVCLYYQDGADFYFTPPSPTTSEIVTISGEGLRFEASVSAPFKVRDHDMGAARRARSWFENYCTAKGWTCQPV